MLLSRRAAVPEHGRARPFIQEALQALLHVPACMRTWALRFDASEAARTVTAVATGVMAGDYGAIPIALRLTASAHAAGMLDRLLTVGNGDLVRQLCAALGRATGDEHEAALHLLVRLLPRCSQGELVSQAVELLLGDGSGEQGNAAKLLLAPLTQADLSPWLLLLHRQDDEEGGGPRLVRAFLGAMFAATKRLIVDEALLSQHFASLARCVAAGGPVAGLLQLALLDSLPDLLELLKHYSPALRSAGSDMLIVLLRLRPDQARILQASFKSVIDAPAAAAADAEATDQDMQFFSTEASGTDGATAQGVTREQFEKAEALVAQWLQELRRGGAPPPVPLPSVGSGRAQDGLVETATTVGNIGRVLEAVDGGMPLLLEGATGAGSARNLCILLYTE